MRYGPIARYMTPYQCDKITANINLSLTVQIHITTSQPESLCVMSNTIAKPSLEVRASGHVLNVKEESGSCLPTTRTNHLASYRSLTLGHYHKASS